MRLPCGHNAWTWVDDRGRVTHDLEGWPAQWGWYCYECEGFYDKSRKLAAPPRYRFEDS